MHETGRYCIISEIYISSEFRELKPDLNINNANSKSAFLKRKYSDDPCEFKNSRNKKQFDFNVSILNKVADVKDSLEIEDIEQKLECLIKDIKGRKFICIATRLQVAGSPF